MFTSSLGQEHATFFFYSPSSFLLSVTPRGSNSVSNIMAQLYLHSDLDNFSATIAAITF